MVISRRAVRSLEYIGGGPESVCAPSGPGQVSLRAWAETDKVNANIKGSLEQKEIIEGMDTKELRQAKGALELDISKAIDDLVKPFEEATGIIVKGIEMETQIMKYAGKPQTYKADTKVTVNLDI